MHTRYVRAYILFGILIGASSSLVAQEPIRADSLRRELTRLQARLDSLQRVVASLTREGRDPTPVADELAALRAAAAQAAGGGDTTVVEREQPYTSQGQNLSRLNPEISATGDVRFRANRPGPQQDNVDLREFEFSFQSALDPYASTKIFLAFEDGRFDLEEGYVYWSGLPGGVRADVGRMRQQIGELNRWHLHALPETEYPLVHRTFFGEDGLVADGLRAYWIAPFAGGPLGTHEVWGEVTRGDNEVLFLDGNRLSVLGHLNNFWQLSRSTFVQLGGTGLYGTNPDSALKTTVWGADVRFTWRPPDRALYRSFTLRGEAYAAKRSFTGVGQYRYGGYASAQYQVSRRMFLGTRFDYVESLNAADANTWAIVPTLTWWQSEWVLLHAEWQRSSFAAAGNRQASDQFVLQFVWAIGPHKHEIF